MLRREVTPSDPVGSFFGLEPPGRERNAGAGEKLAAEEIDTAGALDRCLSDEPQTATVGTKVEAAPTSRRC
jgi:hypothetical protein